MSVRPEEAQWADPAGNLDCVFPQFSEGYIHPTAEALREIDTFLMGRNAYEGVASYWPTATDEIARIMNKALKLVFSTTLTNIEWETAKVASGDPVTLITELKGQSGKNIGIAGGSRFAQEVIEAELIDEYRLAFHPVAMGDGFRLLTQRAG